MNRSREVTLLLVFTLTIFTSATLLFLIQPMFARMVLPLLGGAPAVWNTAMVFYQAVLLAGYGYAHLSTKWLPNRWQIALHGSLVLLPLLVLPIGIPRDWTPPTQTNPLPWLLLLLLVAVGTPFFVVSTSGPLLQRWFARTGHRNAADPYFLYAASNLGSMLALITYPVLIEPYLRLQDQSTIWAAGYLLLSVLVMGCGLMLWSARSPVASTDRSAVGPSDADKPRVGGLRKLRWVLLSFVPSSLMLGVTTYLSTDIAAIPLLWIIPLALYLLTFILVFAGKPLIPHLLMVRAFPMVLLPLVIAIVARANQPVALLIPLHLLTFFIAAMVCHGELARDRPDTHFLTEFYLWLSVGGVLGGIFNAIVAPLLFSAVVEYPMTLVFACLLGAQPIASSGWFGRRARSLDLLYPLSLAGLSAVLVMAAGALEVTSSPLSTGMMFGVPALLCFSFSRRPLRFGLGVASILLVGSLYLGPQGQLLFTDRSFFGIHRVTLSPDGKAHMLLHGSTLHGMQRHEPDHRLVPLTYYYPTGPAGLIFDTVDTAKDAPVGVVGMGTGSLACYGQAGQRWTFYEIDPAVERIARDPRFFTFLRDCPPDIDVVLGDARISLASAPDAGYGMLILDAYSSDAIPLHLVSREALQLYRSKITSDGLLLFHISNRHLDLTPVLAALAQDAGLSALVLDDGVVSEAEAARGKTASKWLVMARDEEALRDLSRDPRAARPQAAASGKVWTDDFSSLLSVFNWR